MEKKKIAALVPMRHHSQRVPGKNYRMLAGKPLFHHILDTLLSCPTIDVVAIDTDSPTIMADLAKHYPGVVILERPENLRAPETAMNEVLLWDTAQVPADFYLQTHSTNPLLRSDTISRAVDTFLAQYPGFDSLFGVTRKQIRLWDQLTRPINHNPAILLQTQDLPPVYEENSCLYIFSRSTLEERRNRLGNRPLMFEIHAAEAWDIDEELDFLVADTLLSHQLSKKE
ncbi:MAG: acylneuraminate cytidylyltransferase family protein [Anaerolineae bacterium]|nr:acylneuraminate cytidylyltransferase family protein [Anaerolineae bacterium]